MAGREKKTAREGLALVAKRSRRDLLLDQAARQLNARGISQTALIDLAAALGLSRAAVYYYADDRQDLVFQCYRRACEALARDLAVSSRVPGTALDRIADFIARSLDPERVEEAVLSEVAYLADEQRATIEALAGGVLAQLKALIEQGVGAGEIRACDAGIVAQALLGMISWIPLAPRWVGDDPEIRARATAAAIDLVRNGVAARAQPGDALPRIDVAEVRTSRGSLFSREDAAAMKTEELLRTASRLFNRKGIDAVSLDEVGAAVGATKSVVYHYLTDKPDLVAQCYRRAFALGDRVLAAMDGVEGDGFARAVAGFRLLVEVNARAEFSPLVPLAGVDALHEEARRDIVALARHSEEAFPAAAQAGIADGSIRRIDLIGTAVALAGTFGWIPKWYDGEDEAMTARIADEFQLLYAFGLKAR
jgi:AcrR family transcriptional regulator